MMKISAAAVFVFFFLLGTHAVTAMECYPHCDYYHFYGPFDFTYVRPGLYGYPRCGLRGDCSPFLVYSTSGFRKGQISVRFPSRLKEIRLPP